MSNSNVIILPTIMVVLHGNDFFEVKLMSLIADYDRDTLVNLYQPVIGYSAMAVYFTLWSEANNQKVSSLSDHFQIYQHMGISQGEFIVSRQALEAVGLLKTYLDVQKDTHFYTYELYAPKMPSKFFDDALLFGMLIRAVGEKDANKLKAIYKLDFVEQTGKDISTSFVEYFNPNFDDECFIKALKGHTSIGRNSAKIVSKFSYDIFFTHLTSMSQIKEEAFTRKDMKEIERLATLNGVNEEDAAKIVESVYDPSTGKGKHLDYARLARLFQEDISIGYKTRREDKEPNLNSGDTALAAKINMMELMSPKKFLSTLQNGTKPATSDLRLVDDLSKNFNLSTGVINALIDFCLVMNNNVLSRAYCEKVAASLAREGVETTIDAMNYLRKTSRKNTKGGSKNTHKKVVEEVVKDEPEEASKEENLDDVSWEQMLDDIDDGKANGKA